MHIYNHMPAAGRVRKGELCYDGAEAIANLIK